MYRIIDSRGSGKTSRLMLIAKENHGAIGCSNPEAMKIKAFNYGITGIDFISYTDILTKNYNTNQPIYIDEIENFTKSVCNNFKGYTLSDED